MAFLEATASTPLSKARRALVRPMRDTQRRALLRRALDEGENAVSETVATALKQRYKAVERDLRRANLRKRLVKADHAGDLVKALNLNWPEWIAALGVLIRQALVPIVTRIQVIEQDYWGTHGRTLNAVSPDDVIAAYEQRADRQITNIGDDTRVNTLTTITNWYNTPDAKFGDLVDTLQQYYSPVRAQTIARTEVSHIASQVAHNTMHQLGIKLFNVDLAPEDGPWPCQICIDQAAANPHKRGDQMPPYHPNDRCGVSYVVETEDND